MSITTVSKQRYREQSHGSLVLNTNLHKIWRYRNILLLCCLFRKRMFVSFLAINNFESKFYAEKNCYFQFSELDLCISQSNACSLVNKLINGQKY